MFSSWTSFLSDSDVPPGQQIEPPKSPLRSPRREEKVVVETSELREESLEAMRRLIGSRPEIDFDRTDDQFILRFLRARKFDVEQAFNLYANYYDYRMKNKALFTCFHPSEPGIAQALADGFPGVVPYSDQHNHRIVVLFTRNWDQSRYSLLSVYRAMLLTLEKLLEEEDTQINGLVMIVDWSDFSLKQSSQLSPKLLRLIVEGLQDSFPARFTGIHFINQPWYVEATINLLRSFLKEKTKEKIFVHGSNLLSLHNYIAKAALPSDFGGDQPSFEKGRWAHELIESNYNSSCCDGSCKSANLRAERIKQRTHRSETCPSPLPVSIIDVVYQDK